MGYFDEFKAKESESSEDLEHYGVIGMKWGIRRYQNYDGSLTQRGMKRYNESKANYDKAEDRYKSVKKTGSKADTTNARIARNKAKKQLVKDYKHLKEDKLADQGKVLYSEGARIRSNTKTQKILKTVGLASFATLIVTAKHTDQTTKNILRAVGATSLVAAGIKKGVNKYENKRLQAYYGHTSDY